MSPAINATPELYLMENLEPESILSRVLNLCAGYVGAALKTKDLPGWQVGQRHGRHERLEIEWQGQAVAELVLYRTERAVRPENLTQMAAMAIAHAIRLARAEHAANIDPLTGLSNRRAFESNAHASDGQVAILLDLDHFKVINDTYGHNAGDQVLRSVAKRLTNNLRAGDQAYRWGGEEFLVILNIQPGDNAAAIADRLRKQISGTITHGTERVKITASAGVASHASDVTQLIELADRALYLAKDNGRNQTCDLLLA